jgi:acetoacetyl-CoA reductase
MVMAVPEKVRNQIVEQIPVGRLGGTHEVGFPCFLPGFGRKPALSPGANYSINGGQHMY